MHLAIQVQGELLAKFEVQTLVISNPLLVIILLILLVLLIIMSNKKVSIVATICGYQMVCSYRKELQKEDRFQEREVNQLSVWFKGIQKTMPTENLVHEIGSSLELAEDFAVGLIGIVCGTMVHPCSFREKWVLRTYKIGSFRISERTSEKVTSELLEDPCRINLHGIDLNQSDPMASI